MTKVPFQSERSGRSNPEQKNGAFLRFAGFVEKTSNDVRVAAAAGEREREATGDRLSAALHRRAVYHRPLRAYDVCKARRRNSTPKALTNGDVMSDHQSNNNFV